MRFSSVRPSLVSKTTFFDVISFPHFSLNSVSISFCQTISLSLSLSLSLSFCLFVSPFDSVSNYRFHYLSVFLFISLSIFQPLTSFHYFSPFKSLKFNTYLYTYLPIYLPTFLSTYLFTYLSTYLSQTISFCLWLIYLIFSSLCICRFAFFLFFYFHKNLSLSLKSVQNPILFRLDGDKRSCRSTGNNPQSCSRSAVHVVWKCYL